jgi:hypothetical protein
MHTQAMWMYAQTHTHIHILNVYIHIHIQTRIHTYTYTNRYTYIYIHKHITTQVPSTASGILIWYITKHLGSHPDQADLLEWAKKLKLPGE